MWHWICFKNTEGRMLDFLVQGDADSFIEANRDSFGTGIEVGTFNDYEAGELTFKGLALTFPVRFNLPGIIVKPAQVIHSDILDRLDALLAPRSAKVEPSEHGMSFAHLRWMILQLRTETNKLKAHRWLGYIQGVMVDDELTTLAEERDFCRPYLKES